MVKACPVIPHLRILATSLVLLALFPTRALPASDAWDQCEADELASEIVPPATEPFSLETAPIHVEAGWVESSPTQSVLEGGVRLSRGNQRLQADRITLERPANRAVVEGPFTYGDPQQAVRGNKSAEIDLNAESGRFQEVDYYLPGRNAQGSADEVRVERRRQRTRLGDATYSTCARGKEQWELRTHRLTLNEATGRGEARDIVLALWDKPVFYFPYLTFPINDERQSGFLFPMAGYSNLTGFSFALPYYWNIAPERDFTLTPRWMTQRGLLLGAEYRFISPKDQGQIRLEYLPHDQTYGDTRGSLNLTHRAAPLPNTYTNLRYEYVSDETYLQDLDNNLSFLTPNYLDRYFDVRYQGNGWEALARVQGYQILNPWLFSRTGRPYQRMPQLLFEGAWPTASGGLSYQLHGELVNFQQDNAVTGTRLDLWPTVRWAWERPWGYLKPEAGFRHTSYQLTDTTPGMGDNPSRSAPIASLDTGLVFDRPLQASWLGVPTGTQTLEPRLFYLYVPYRNQNDIPVFDTVLMDRDHDWLFRRNRFAGGDRLGDANQLTAAVTTRVIDGASGRERLRASIGQIEYFADRKVTLEATDRPDTTTRSGLIAEGDLNLSWRWSIHGGLQMEPDNGDVLRNAVDLRYYGGPRQLINFSYLMDRDQPDLDVNDQIHSVDVSLMWPLSSQWRLLSRWNQALNVSRNLETLAGLEYESCCWAARAVARRYRTSTTQVDSENAFYLELELKGLSRLGEGLESILQSSILGYQPLSR